MQRPFAICSSRPLLDAPMFTIRWRWNATRSLAVPRFRGGAKIAAPLQRMESEKSSGRSFPGPACCLEHIVGDREIPDHPLVKQTISDCLTEAMDIDGLEGVLRRIDRARSVASRVTCLSRRRWLRKFSTRDLTRFWITRLWKSGVPRRFTRGALLSATAARVWEFSTQRQSRKCGAKPGRNDQCG